INYHALPAEVLRQGGKISRGENYLGLPWIVLDYPRCFSRTHIFAIRTLFWWGRFFSTTLHLSGDWQQQHLPKLTRAFTELQDNNLSISYSGDEWVHDITSAAYTPLRKLTQTDFEKIVRESAFIKIAASAGIGDIENATEILMQQFRFFLSIVSEK